VSGEGEAAVLDLLEGEIGAQMEVCRGYRAHAIAEQDARHCERAPRLPREQSEERGVWWRRHGCQPGWRLASIRVKRPPSDYELLKAIYERHRGDFVGPRVTASTGVYLPIDIPAIAADVGTDADTVFGRLYHHLDRTYGEPPVEGKPRRGLFSAKLGAEANLINFPLLEAVLAGLWQERNRQLWAVWASAFSVAIALAALVVSIVSIATA
jgi:hypothetical protein